MLILSEIMLVKGVPYNLYLYASCVPHWLNNLPLNKMAVIVADDISKCILLNEKPRILIENSL